MIIFPGVLVIGALFMLIYWAWNTLTGRKDRASKRKRKTRRRYA